MKFVLDYAPLGAFGLSYWLGDIYLATEVFIGACFIVVLLGYLIEQRLNKVHLITAIVAALLGGLTLALHDPAFIKFKPTLIYGIFALALLGSHFIGERVLLARLPQTTIALPDPLWRRINLAWGIFFIVLALLNLYVAHQFSEATWVKFKVFGCTVLTFVFLLAHLPFVAKYLEPETQLSTTGKSRP